MSVVNVVELFLLFFVELILFVDLLIVSSVSVFVVIIIFLVFWVIVSVFVLFLLLVRNRLWVILFLLLDGRFRFCVMLRFVVWNLKFFWNCLIVKDMLLDVKFRLRGLVIVLVICKRVVLIVMVFVVCVGVIWLMFRWLFMLFLV